MLNNNLSLEELAEKREIPFETDLEDLQFWFGIQWYEKEKQMYTVNNSCAFLYLGYNYDTPPNDDSFYFGYAIYKPVTGTDYYQYAGGVDCCFVTLQDALKALYEDPKTI